MVRALGLNEQCYDRLLDFFHSTAIDEVSLGRCWTAVVLRCCNAFLLCHNGRIVILGDGIKSAKCGKKMPAVKRLHQESESNTKPDYIFGHSCQAFSVVAGFMKTFFSIAFCSRDLLWMSAAVTVRFVAVVHPNRGSIILMSTDKSPDPLDIIRLYGIRFKIEVSFKQAVHTIVTYAYHFWMADMTPRSSRSGNQHLHMKTDDYREKVRRKMRAYHCHMRIGLIAQGIMQYLSLANSQLVWNTFGSWIRTIRPGVLPSEAVVATALRHTLPQFLMDSSKDQTFPNFLRPRIDFERAEGARLAA